MREFKEHKKPSATASDTFFKARVQPKLQVGQPGDAFEKEADSVADAVVSKSGKNDIQKAGNPEEEKVQKKPIAESISSVQMKEVKEEDPTLQKKEEEEQPVMKKEDEDPTLQKKEDEEKPVMKKEDEDPTLQKKEEEEQPVMKKEDEDPTLQKKKEEEQPVMKKEEEDPTLQKKEDEEPVMKKEEEDKLQKKSTSTSTASPKSSLETRLSSSKGKGSKLGGSVRNEMESGFGADFSNVNIHTDQNAVQMSEELGAKAFAHGNDVYFNKGQYNRESSEGKHLLAHELTHTIQQKGMVQKQVQRKDLESPRFAGNPSIEKVLNGKLLVGTGSNGAHVRIIQQALLDAGFALPKFGVDGSFGAETKVAVIAFQKARGLIRKDQDGIVGKQTMEQLDTQYTGYSTENKLLAGKTEAEVLKGTREITKQEKADVDEAMSTEVKVDPITKAEPVFDVANKDQYKKELRDATELIALGQYDRLGKGKAALRSDQKNLHDPKDLDNLGKTSKNETDKVYGGFKKGAPLSYGTNIFDGWEKKQAELTGKSAALQDSIKKDWADWRIKKIVEGPDLSPINEKYGAVQRRPVEAAIVRSVISELSLIHRDKLVQTHLGWPGFADDGKIFLQRYKSSNSEENRKYMWQNFGTIIHEYIHTLEDPRSRTYRQTLDDKKGGKVLREGVTDYFTKVVYKNVTFTNQSFRKSVEGPFYDPAKSDAPQRGYYDEAKNAEKMAGIVGTNNLAASFFLGKIELIKGK